MTLHQVYKALISVLGSNREVEIIKLICLKNKIKINDFYQAMNTTISKFTSKTLKEAIKKILEDQPVEYIAGCAMFDTFLIKVNEHTLIPRPESLELCELVVSELKLNVDKKLQKMIDVGTGSGVLSLKLSPYFSEVWATDISKEALKVAKQNFKSFNIDSIKAYQSDLMTGLEEGANNFNLIVANLPYINHDEQLPKSVGYEPQSAIYAPVNSLDFYKKAIDQFAVKCIIKGVIALEINPLDSEHLMVFMKNNHKNFSSKAYKDFNGFNRFLIAARNY